MALLDWLLPPKWRSFLQRFKSHGYSGDYPNWTSASRASTGYADTALFEKVKEAARAVKAGRAAFDRDSVLFHHQEYDFPVLSALLFVKQQQSTLEVLDLGGATGSMYFQYRPLFESESNLHWLVVEQPHFVAFGRAELEDVQLRFCETIVEATSNHHPNLALLGCVLPYLEDPYHWLDKVYTEAIPYLLIDKHPLIPGQRDRLTVQKTNPKVYDASYPAWFFGEEKFRAALAGRYKIIFEYVCPDQSNLPGSTFKGFFLKRLS
jgi:putative methyltransferase (TIGR04325 family)